MSHFALSLRLSLYFGASDLSATVTPLLAHPTRPHSGAPPRWDEAAVEIVIRERAMMEKAWHDHFGT